MQKGKILQNAKWIILCRIFQSVIQLVVGMLSARYMGPSNYGLINYAASVVAFFVPIMQLGLQATLVQEYIDKPEMEGQILGTSLMLNTISAIICMIGVGIFASFANKGEQKTVIVCLLYSVCLLSQGIEMLQYWFQSKLMSKYYSLSMLFAYVIASLYKIYLLITQKNIYWFALSHAVEYGLSGLLLLVICYRKCNQHISTSWKTAKKLFSKSKNYILATLVEVVYHSMGTVLLKIMHGETETGYYAVAVTCSCITGFVFRAVFDTARPVILEAKKNNRLEFENNVINTYSITNTLSLLQSVFITLFSGIIVRLLYGKAYLPAVPVLQILIWCKVFSYAAYVRNIWILAEEKHNVLIWINLGGAAVNLLLNVCLIPQLGACGAAIATVFAHFFADFIMGFILRSMRLNNRLLIKGLRPSVIIKLVLGTKRFLLLKK